MKKTLALILCVVMTACVFTACSSKDGNGGEQDTTATTAAAQESKTPSEPTQLNAKKLKSLSGTDYRLEAGGITYRGESGKYGIISPDGEKDTGEKYIYCSAVGNLFAVVSSKPESNDPKASNCIGLVDGNGNVLLEEKYATYSQLNDRYYRVCEVSGSTNNKDDALVYSSDKQFSIVPDDEDSLYKGTWYIFDTKTNSLVDGASGTQAYQINAYGNYLECRDDNKNIFYVNGDGKKLPENAKLNNNGTYQVEDDKSETGEVYDNEDNLLFTYIRHNDAETNHLRGVDSDKNYFICEKEINGSRTYSVLDASGKTISKEFNDNIYVYGDLILSDNKVYDIEGKQLIEGEYDTIQSDNTFGFYYLLRNSESKTSTIIDKNGTVIVKETDQIDGTFPGVYTKKGDDSYSLCYKEKDFTIKGRSSADWTASVKTENNEEKLVDCLSGNTLIEGGYTSFSTVGSLSNGIYVKAVGHDTTDIYLVEAE